MNWVTRAPVMMARKQRAEEAYTEIERLLPQGQTDAAWKQLHPLQLELAELLHENAQAGQAFEARSQYQLLTARIAERLRDHRDFVPIAELAKLGEQAWEAGTWDSARTALGQAGQRLETFLQENETPEELAAREKASVEVLRTIEQERQRQQAEIDQLTAERDRLTDQFLKATQQSVADRDELTKTRAKLLTETGQRTAAEQQVQQQTAQLDTLKREQTTLQTKIGRLEQQTVQLGKLRAELSQTKSEAAATTEQLASAQRQLTAWKAKAQTAASNPLPLTSISTDGFAGTRAGQERDDNGLKMISCWCPGGSFTMGSPASEPDRMADEGPVTVKLSGFWLAKYEFTQGQWEALASGAGKPAAQGRKTDQLPKDSVSWSEATDACRKFTEQERKAGRLPAGWEHRLPTEAQWEYACRAGTKTATAFGDKLDSTQANFDGNYPYNGAAKGPYLQRTTEVGSYAANAWGLHDMHGNVWEWCRDWYRDKLPGGTDPEVTSEATFRVLRGGSWFNFGRFCRSANRGRFDLDVRRVLIGFRVAVVRSG